MRLFGAAFTLLLSLLGVGWATTDSCPPNCSCDSSMLGAICSGARLKVLPDGFPPNFQHLDLSNNSLTTFGKNNALFPQLLTLDLSHNLIANLDFLKYVSMPKLYKLNLDHNHLVKIPEGSLKALPELRELTVKDNSLDSVCLSTVSDAKKLLKIDLSHNYIKDLGLQNSYFNMSHIESLDISSNSMSKLRSCEWNSLLDVQVLNLSLNQLTSIPSIYQNLTIAQLFLNNNVTSINTTYDSLMMNETFNALYSIEENENAKTRNVKILDLSHNNLEILHSHAFQQLYDLETLLLQYNQLSTLNPVWFEALSNVKTLDVSGNPIKIIPARAFKNCSLLQYLTASRMPNLTHIHYEAFSGLYSLKELVISDNNFLDYLHANTLTPLSSLQKLDIRNDAIKTLYPDLFAEVPSLETVYISGNKLICDCDFEWIHEWITKFHNTMPEFYQPENTVCTAPAKVSDKPINQLGEYNFSCSGAHIINYTRSEDALFQVGSPAVIDCIASGSPHPRVTWTTPTGNQALHYPAYINWLRPGPQHHTFHANHPWHDHDSYDKDVPHSERIYVLSNGSLYVDYMLRNDAGTYTCMVNNPFGNKTIVIHVRLDYSIFKDNVNMSLIVGFSCATSFFFIAVLIAAIRYVAYFCSKEQREKRKGIREVLASLEQYRLNKFDKISAYKTMKFDRISAYKTEKFDRLSAYKTEKFDKLSAYKSAKFDQLTQYRAGKVDKLRNYKTFNFTTLVHYIKGMREHYLEQVVKIKENCAQQGEKLRENYSTKSCAFKDYRSTKIDALRENYVAQVMKIREYGSSQMAKLREQYKIQQNHVLKLIEIMDIANCMNIVEEECMRTESMLLDPTELDFDFDTHPVHIIPHPFHSDDNESFYETAGSNVDIAMDTNIKHVAETNELEKREKTGRSHARAGNAKQRNRKTKKHRHKRPTNLPSFDDPDYDDAKENKKRRRKLRREKPTIDFQDGDTTAPDTPPEGRSSIMATVHTEQEVPSSEYESATASNTREQTPEAPLTGVADVGQAVLDFTTTRSPLLSKDASLEQVPGVDPTCMPIGSDSTTSTPTLTDDHVIIMDPNDTADTGTPDEVNMESTV